MSNVKRIGTADFYYQAAEDLDKLGVEFAILVREKASKSTVVLHNVDDVETANSMFRNLQESFDSRFGPPSPPES